MVSVIKVHSDPVEGAYELHVCKSVIRVDFSGENINEIYTPGEWTLEYIFYVTSLLFIKARLLNPGSSNVHNIPLPGKIFPLPLGRGS